MVLKTTSGVQSLEVSPTAPLYTPSEIKNWERDFYLGSGGTISDPDIMSGSVCLDVHDVWDSQFTAGEGGPVPG